MHTYILVTVPGERDVRFMDFTSAERYIASLPRHLRERAEWYISA
jgi:hypothetical protein